MNREPLNPAEMTTMNTHPLRILVCLTGLALLLLPACRPDDDPPVDPEAEATALWEQSAHADATSAAATHWDGAEPPEIPVNCAKCHSVAGFVDFLGADGSTPGVVDMTVPVGHGDNAINCHACHDETGMLRRIESAAFPSGVVLEGLGNEAVCMQCHQGTRSGADVDRAIADSGALDDEVSASLAFINIHYGVAAVTLYGSEVGGGYEYAGQTYPGKIAGTSLHRNLTGLTTCTGCHDSHSLKTDCSSCHSNFDRVKNELTGLQAQLYAALQTYAADVAGVALVYAEDSYPYFFAGTAGGETYRAWTPRLLRAAYNYHLSLKDTGAFAHNARYVGKLLEDSIKDLQGELEEQGGTGGEF